MNKDVCERAVESRSSRASPIRVSFIYVWAESGFRHCRGDVGSAAGTATGTTEGTGPPTMSQVAIGPAGTAVLPDHASLATYGLLF